MHRKTLQSAVNFIDRYLSRCTAFPRARLQLLGPHPPPHQNLAPFPAPGTCPTPKPSEPCRPLAPAGPTHNRPRP
jgi:hypothetical protein